MTTTLEGPTSAETSKTTTKTMHAAVVHGFDRPLQLDEVATPVAGRGEVVVRIEASGLCHTDIHAAHGDWPVKPTPPFTPGHEGVGIVEEIGPDVTEVVVGDRVAIPWLGYACGTCDYCVSGWETLCLEQKNMGYTLDGSFADYVKAYARYVVKVPLGVDPVDAAPLTCAGVTTYKAVKVAGTKPSDLVAVFGVGGLGTSRSSTPRSREAASWRWISLTKSSSSRRSSAPSLRSTPQRRTPRHSSRCWAEPTRQSRWR
jgi:D-arabinose 1-dehydrogenase-like Zn-dependent alcohol dehydrogenase